MVTWRYIPRTANTLAKCSIQGPKPELGVRGRCILTVHSDAMFVLAAYCRISIMMILYCIRQSCIE